MIGQCLENKESVRGLGVLFNRELSLLGFIMLCSKLFKNIIVIKSLYFVFVVNKLEYISLVWYPFYASHIRSIEKIRRSFVKYLSFKVDGVYSVRNIDYNFLQRRGIVSLSCRFLICFTSI